MIAQCDARVHEHVHLPCLVFCADTRGVTVRGLTLFTRRTPASGATRAGGDRAPRSWLERRGDTRTALQCTAAARTRTGQGQGHRCSVQRHPGGN